MNPHETHFVMPSKRVSKMSHSVLGVGITARAGGKKIVAFSVIRAFYSRANHTVTVYIVAMINVIAYSTIIIIVNVSFLD